MKLHLAARGTPAASRKPIALALQGGGSWGAYTWGVLDALLGSRRVAITQLSGTSAGAINAAIVASALATGSPALARRRLRSFWLSIAQPPIADVAHEVWGPLSRPWRQAVGAWLMSGTALSPYAVNPLGVNPLREPIAAHVDFDALKHRGAPALFVTVTSVRTGLPRVLSNESITLDALLASACLPQLFQAVEIDGEPYWDGGYCGNPTLWPMIHGGPARDLVVVQLAPESVPELPRDAAAIRRRIGEIVFHSSLVAEMQAIAAMRSVAARGEAAANVLGLRLHRIGPPPADLFDEGSGVDRSRTWLERLHVEGRDGARRFLVRHGRDLGVRETLDVARVFSDERKPKVRVPANEDSFVAPDGARLASTQ